MKLSNIIGKQVYAIYEGKMIGTILSANFNYEHNKVLSFTIFDNDDEEYELALLNTKAIDECVLITNKNKLNKRLRIYTSPMLKQVIDNDAKNCGQLIDIEFNKDGIIQTYITSNGLLIEPANVYVREEFIYISKTKVCISNYKPKNKRIDPSNILVNILNITDDETRSSFIPTKIQYNPESILGKIAKNDLLGLNNEVIVKTNQTITQKIIDDAGKHNRLNQLYYIAN